jgi:hypothetical protein
MNHENTKGIEPVTVKISNEPLVYSNLNHLGQPKDSMMRRKEIQSEIDRLKRKVEELEGLIAEPEFTRDTGIRIHNPYQRHYYIRTDGKIDECKASMATVFDSLNSFDSYDQAAREAAYTLASRRVRAFAKAVNGEWKADWIDTDQDKYGIIYNENTYDARFRRTSNEFVHQISFPTEELAAKALELFRDEWQILANP